MKITNYYQLPRAYVNGVKIVSEERVPIPFEYDYSVSDLLRPPRVAVLTNRWKDKLTHDAHDMRSLVMGTAFHSIMERGARETFTFWEAIIEEPMKAAIEVEGRSYVVCGIPDLFETDTGELWDWKTCKVFKFQKQDFLDWERQLNLYAWILRQNNHTVGGLNVLANITDWNPQAAKMKGVPPTAITELKVELWPEDYTVSFLIDLITKRLDAEEKLPLCTDEERIAQPEKFAVRKEGAKRASRIFEDPIDASIYAVQKGDDYVVETRPGVQVRCEKFPCPVRNVCDQYKQIKGESS